MKLPVTVQQTTQALTQGQAVYTNTYEGQSQVGNQGPTCADGKAHLLQTK